MHPASRLIPAALVASLFPGCVHLQPGEYVDPASAQEAAVYQTWGAILVTTGVLSLGAAGAGAAVIDSSGTGISATPMLYPAGVGLASVIIGAIVISQGNHLLLASPDRSLDVGPVAERGPAIAPEDRAWRACWTRCGGIGETCRGTVRQCDDEVSMCEIHCGERPTIKAARIDPGKPAWTSDDGKCFDRFWAPIPCPAGEHVVDVAAVLATHTSTRSR